MPLPMLMDRLALAATMLALSACGNPTGRPLDLDAADARDGAADARPRAPDVDLDPDGRDASGDADTGPLPDAAPRDVGPSDAPVTPDLPPADAAPADAAPADADVADDASPADAEAPDAAPPPIPTGGGPALQAWLEAGHYQGWAHESAPRASSGPHFTQVRTFLNAPLDASLAQGAPAHPAGAAAVKELYGGGKVQGWAVAIKVQANSALGSGWRWYERHQGATTTDAVGATLCAGCHAGGKDFILSPHPLK